LIVFLPVSIPLHPIIATERLLHLHQGIQTILVLEALRLHPGTGEVFRRTFCIVQSRLIALAGDGHKVHLLGLVLATNPLIPLAFLLTVEHLLAMLVLDTPVIPPPEFHRMLETTYPLALETVTLDIEGCERRSLSFCILLEFLVRWLYLKPNYYLELDVLS
jgi:hypothetical protein